MILFTLSEVIINYLIVLESEMQYERKYRLSVFSDILNDKYGGVYELA